MDENSALKVAELIARGLDKRIDTLEANLNDQMAEVKTELAAIREQTTKTNGRVTRLEAWKDGLARAFTNRTETVRFRVTTVAAYGAALAAGAEALRLIFG